MTKSWQGALEQGSPVRGAPCLVEVAGRVYPTSPSHQLWTVLEGACPSIRPFAAAEMDPEEADQLEDI